MVLSGMIPYTQKLFVLIGLPSQAPKIEHPPPVKKSRFRAKLDEKKQRADEAEGPEERLNSKG